MKVAVAANGEQVSAHFGRCEHYVIVQVEDGRETTRETITNPGHEPGALPKLMQQHGVDVVICGGAGPRAVGLLAQAGVELVQGASGTVDEAIAQYLAGGLEDGPSACHH